MPPMGAGILPPEAGRNAASFPWRSLQRVTARRSELVCDLLRAVGPVRAWQAAGRALTALVGESVEVRLGGADVISRDEALRRLEEMAAALKLGAPAGPSFWFAADAAAVSALAAAAAGHPPPSVVVPRQATEPEAAVLAAATGCVLSDIGFEAEVKVLSIHLPSTEAMRGQSGSAFFWLALSVSMKAFSAGAAILGPVELLQPGMSFSKRLAASGARTESAAVRRLSGVTIAAAVESVPAHLSLSEIEALEQGDVLVFQGLHANGASLRLRVGRGGYGLRPETEPRGVADCPLGRSALNVCGGFSVTEEREFGFENDQGQKGTTTGTVRESARAEDGQSGLVLQELEVEVVVEVGRVALSAAELVTLAPGSVIRLDRPLEGISDLRAGGKLVARGELVDVEGMLGFRVGELINQ